MKYLLLITLLFSINSYSEIFRISQVCNESGKMCFYWWPKLQKIDGWSQDQGSSYHFSMNTQAPNGYTFSNSDSVIYAKAEYRHNDDRTLKEFIKDAQSQFVSASSPLTLKYTKDLKSESGLNFNSYSFKPKQKGNWEQVSYSEETDKDGNKYWLIFALSSRSEEGYLESLDTYYKFISSYK